MSRKSPWPVAIVAALLLFISIQIGLIVIVSRDFEGPIRPHFKHGLDVKR